MCYIVSMSRTKKIFDAYRTVRIYGEDYKIISRESESSGVPIIRIIKKLIATIDKSNKSK
jgi:hypothetical protein